MTYTRQDLAILEKHLATRAARCLDSYCRYIEIPGAPINDSDDCDQFYPDTVTPAKHHRVINSALQDISDGKLKRLIVMMPPGSAKSTYCTVVFPTWYMGKNPRKNIISTSYGTTLAQKFARKCRQITRSAAYHAVFGTKLVSDHQSVLDWSLTNESTYMAGGILSGITGNRADGIIIDDPVKGREDADSAVIRDKTWDAYLNDIRTRLKPGGFIVIIQTRWHEDDLSGRILPENYDGESGDIESRDGEVWRVISLQAQCERDDDPLQRAPGEWLWPEWFTPEHWRQEKRTQGERNWAALYQQRPKPAEGALVKRAWIKRYNEKPAVFIRIVQSWDTGIKDSDVNDPSVCTTWGETPDGYYLLDVFRERLTYPDLYRAVHSAATKWLPQTILIEDKASGQSLIQQIRREGNLAVVAVDPKGVNKRDRMTAASGIIESGRLFLPQVADWLMDYESELYGFPLTTHDDQVDSTSQFINWAHRYRTTYEHASLPRRDVDRSRGKYGRF